MIIDDQGDENAIATNPSESEITGSTIMEDLYVFPKMCTCLADLCPDVIWLKFSKHSVYSEIWQVQWSQDLWIECSGDPRGYRWKRYPCYWCLSLQASDCGHWESRTWGLWICVWRSVRACELRRLPHQLEEWTGFSTRSGLEWMIESLWIHPQLWIGRLHRSDSWCIPSADYFADESDYLVIYCVHGSEVYDPRPFGIPHNPCLRDSGNQLSTILRRWVISTSGYEPQISRLHVCLLYFNS